MKITRELLDQKLLALEQVLPMLFEDVTPADRPAQFKRAADMLMDQVAPEDKVYAMSRLATIQVNANF